MDKYNLKIYDVSVSFLEEATALLRFAANSPEEAVTIVSSIGSSYKEFKILEVTEADSQYELFNDDTETNFITSSKLN